MAIRQDKAVIVDKCVEDITQTFGELGLTIEEAETVLQATGRFLQQLRYSATNPMLCPKLEPAPEQQEEPKKE